jgi:hypothetical protein
MLRENHTVFWGKKYRFPRGGGGINIRFRPKYRPLTYDESVLKLSKVSFWGKCARTGHPLKIPSPTKLTRLGHFPLVNQAGRFAGPVFYTKYFLCPAPWRAIINLRPDKQEKA